MALPSLLYAAGNRFTTILSGAIIAGDLSITLTSVSGLNTTGGALIIDKDNASTREIVYYTSIAGSTLTIPSGGRGVAGTSAVAHSSGATVSDVGISNQVNSLVDYIKTTIYDTIYPVGSIYSNASDSTNPGTLLGFGTWVAFGAGQVLVGIDAGQTEFNTIGKTGGEKTHALITAELASHTHTQNSHNHTQDAHKHLVFNNYSFQVGGGSTANVSGVLADGYGNETANTTATNQATTAVNQSTGSGTAHNNLQPYITVYLWKRTV